MTEFEAAVLAVLQRLESGEVVTYGEVAAEAGFPGAARAVGTLLRTTAVDVPWWRVVGSSGQVRTDPIHRQRELLAAEGVLVRNDRVERLGNR